MNIALSAWLVNYIISLIWASIGIVFGFFIGANNVAHVGGFVAGAALGFVLEPDAPSKVSSVGLWNATAIGCIGLVAISFVMAGRAYGSEQEKDVQRATLKRQYQSKYQFAQIVEHAFDTIDDSFGVNGKPDNNTRESAHARAAELRRIAVELDKTLVADDRAMAIKTRLLELMNARAKVLEAASNSTGPASVSSNREAFDAVFQDFSDWERSVVEEFRNQLDR